RVAVDYHGTPTPLKQLTTNIGCVNGNTIVINLWDISVIREASKALTNANLGATPIDDGRIIRMVFPQLTEERRKELVKQVRRICEDSKVAMRNARREAMDRLKRIAKEDKIGEDDVEDVQDGIQELLDNYVSSCDKILIVKEKEIMEI
ncbi:MAG: ribosome recycling factor, partial [Firmicutes bacterium]|nr:ribosome recycling factor [Bacillota bacterium]